MIDNFEVLRELSTQVKTTLANVTMFGAYAKGKTWEETGDKLVFQDAKTRLRLAVPRLAYVTQRGAFVDLTRPMAIPMCIAQDMALKFDASYWHYLVGKYDEAKPSQFEILDPFQAECQDYNALILYAGWNWLDSMTEEGWRDLASDIYGKQILASRRLEDPDGYSGEWIWVVKIGSSSELNVMADDFRLSRANGILRAAGVDVDAYAE